MNSQHEFTTNPRRQLRRVFIGLGVLFVAVLLMFWRRPMPAPAVVVVSTWSSNKEQFVTFKLQPKDAVVAFADIVPATDDNSQPQVLSFGPNARPPLLDMELPLIQGLQLRYVSLPFNSVDSSGSNRIGTPGSYTIAYSPTSAVSQLRVGVANQEPPLSKRSWTKRILRAKDEGNLQFLLLPTHAKPVYVKSAPITNFTAVLR